MSDLPRCTFCGTELISGSVCSSCGARSVLQDGERLWFKGDSSRSGPSSPPTSAVWIVALVFGGLIVFGLLMSGDDEGPSAAPRPPDPEERRLAAFDVCKKFVSHQLKSPSTAKYRNYFEDDGEVIVSGSGAGPYIVRSTVDSQNSFGALIRSSFTCTVRNTGGVNWQLVNLDFIDGGR